MRRTARYAVWLFIFVCICLIGLAGTLTQMGKLNALSLSMRAQEAFLSAPVSLLKSSVPSSAEIVGEDETDETVFSSYTAPEGVIIKSFSSKWGESKLKALYEELKSNVTGREITYLREILLYGQEQENILGAQEESYGEQTIRLRENGLGDGFEYTVYTEMSTIRLYGGDSKTTVASMAKTLSHEYGHLFTNHYFFQGLSNDELLQSNYALVRGLSQDGRIRTDMSDYPSYIANHAWYLREIAAEDYVQLMGSPQAKARVECYDAMQRLENRVESGKELPSNTEYAGGAYNINPQENLSLPLADEVEGLKELFASCVGLQAQQAAAGNDITISVESKTETYRLTSGKTKYRYFEIRFSGVEDAALYTLLLCNQDGSLYYPVKTVSASGERAAVVGNVPLAAQGRVYSLDNGVTGKKLLRVTAILEDGRITISKPFSFDFGGGE